MAKVVFYQVGIFMSLAGRLAKQFLAQFGGVSPFYMGETFDVSDTQQAIMLIHKLERAVIGEAFDLIGEDGLSNEISFLLNLEKLALIFSDRAPRDYGLLQLLGCLPRFKYLGLKLQNSESASARYVAMICLSVSEQKRFIFDAELGKQLFSEWVASTKRIGLDNSMAIFNRKPQFGRVFGKANIFNGALANLKTLFQQIEESVKQTEYEGTSYSKSLVNSLMSLRDQTPSTTVGTHLLLCIKKSTRKGYDDLAAESVLYGASGTLIGILTGASLCERTLLDEAFNLQTV